MMSGRSLRTASYGAFAAVHAQVQATHERGICRFAYVARHIPPFRLYLDDVGTEVGQGLGAVGAKDHGGHVGNAYATKD